MSNFIKDGETIRFTGQESNLDPEQKALAAGGVSFKLPPTPTQQAVRQGDVNAPYYLEYDRKIQDRWKGP